MHQRSFLNPGEYIPRYVVVSRWYYTHHNRVYTSSCIWVATLSLYIYTYLFTYFFIASGMMLWTFWLAEATAAYVKPCCTTFVRCFRRNVICCQQFASTDDENPAHWQYFTKAHRQKDGHGSGFLYFAQLFCANECEPGHESLYPGSEHARHLPNVAPFLSFSISFTALHKPARLSLIAIAIVAWSCRKP